MCVLSDYGTLFPARVSTGMQFTSSLFFIHHCHNIIIIASVRMSLGPNFIGTLPQPDKGAFITVANLTAKGEEELKTLLSILYNIHKSANSDAEPDCIGVCVRL